jgi:hypothetical protein
MGQALFGDTTAPYIFFKVLKAIDQWNGWREDHIYSTWHPDFKNTKETHRFSVGPNLVPPSSDYFGPQMNPAATPIFGQWQVTPGYVERAGPGVKLPKVLALGPHVLPSLSEGVL